MSNTVEQAVWDIFGDPAAIVLKYYLDSMIPQWEAEHKKKNIGMKFELLYRTSQVRKWLDKRYSDDIENDGWANEFRLMRESHSIEMWGYHHLGGLDKFRIFHRLKVINPLGHCPIRRHRDKMLDVRKAIHSVANAPAWLRKEKRLKEIRRQNGRQLADGQEFGVPAMYDVNSSYLTYEAKMPDGTTTIEYMPLYDAISRQQLAGQASMILSNPFSGNTSHLGGWIVTETPAQAQPMNYYSFQQVNRAPQIRTANTRVPRHRNH